MQSKIRLRAGVLFSALGNDTRLRIVELLVAQPRSVNEIAAQLKIGQSGASQHLAILLRAGLLVVHPSGTSRVYAVRGPRIGQILGLIEEFCDRHGLEGDDDIPIDLPSDSLAVAE